MAKRILDFHITRNTKLNKDIFVLELVSNEALPVILPGQFVQARVDKSPGTFLRRPFSVHDVDYKEKSIKLLIQVAGEGTRTLSDLTTGDILNLVIPLGNSFSMPLKEEKTLLIGGGCGVAPLLYLSKFLKSNDYQFEILLGFRNRERIIELEEYKTLGKVYLSTEDGSEGEKGFVTQHPVLDRAEYKRIYCCGPELMMKSVAKYSRKHNLVCEVSLENLMACGLGVCLCCVVNTVNGNVCSCTDGPVFNIKDLKW